MLGLVLNFPLHYKFCLCGLFLDFSCGVPSRGGGGNRGKTLGPVKILLLQNNIQEAVCANIADSLSEMNTE